MNDTQTLVVNSDANFITVAAGPGSGKTTTAIARIVRLIKDGCSPSAIVAITFTNAAAREIESRLAKAMGSETKLGYAGTLHGFLLRLIQTHANLINYQPGITVIDDSDKNHLTNKLIETHRWKGSLVAIEQQIAGGPYNAGKTKEEIIALDYYKSLRRSNMMDFDAILFYGLVIVKKISATVYQHLLVDEYQDSGELDAKIYEALAIKNKMFIGDPDQSIYKFRGARPEIMTAQIFSERGHKVVLETNYRCGKNICEVANRLISNNPNRFNKRTLPGGILEGAVYIREFENPIAEMNYIAGEIDRSGLPAESFAILTRSNAQAREIASFIEAVGIKVARKTDRTFPNGWHQMLTLLKFLSNPDNDELAAEWIQCQNGEQAAKAAQKKALEGFTSINQTVFKFPSQISILFAQRIIQESNVTPESSLLVIKGVRRLHNPETASIAELLCVLNTEDFGDEAEHPGVTVCTIHKAKGREWGNVYLPGFEQGMIPLTSGTADLEEERRLAFVAVTRAKQMLAISHCKRRTKEWLGEVNQTPSQFIQEMMLRQEIA